MPELPEVETIKNDLKKNVIGKKILKITTDSPKQLKPTFKILEKNIVGQTIKEIKRRAKLILFYLSNGKIFVVHLKLTGRLLLRKNSDPKDEWQHVVFDLGGGEQLRFADLRKFGYIRLVENERELTELLSEFGPEPLTKEFTLEKFKEILAQKNSPIKLVLMDQKTIAGVGNIYANEALFLAKINPREKAQELSAEEVKKLYESLEKVLQEGVRYRGASDQTYLDAFGQKGQYQEHFRVYAQDGKNCLNRCGGKIHRFPLGGRGTFFCPECQK